MTVIIKHAYDRGTTLDDLTFYFSNELVVPPDYSQVDQRKIDWATESVEELRKEGKLTDNPILALRHFEQQGKEIYLAKSTFATYKKYNLLVDKEKAMNPQGSYDMLSSQVELETADNHLVLGFRGDGKPKALEHLTNRYLCVAGFNNY
ncbi:MAG TPA: hypothetical protein VJJ75_01805, partial [Candidatus Nanoarchaeia archaeon]|nr:hypothetical protein [Candidatus Nanoarchaeia archaeon]